MGNRTDFEKSAQSQGSDRLLPSLLLAATLSFPLSLPRYMLFKPYPFLLKGSEPLYG